MGKQSSFFLISVFTLSLTGCAQRDAGPPKEMPAVPVVAASPTVKDLTVYIESIGTLKPQVFMEIRPQVSGTIVEVLTSEGRWVKEGTPLFKIDSKPYAIRVKEGEAQLAIEKANYQAAQKKLDRFKDLVRQDFVAQTEWDDLVAQAAKSLAAIDLQEARLNAAKIDLDHCLMTSPTEGRIGKLDVHPGLLVAAGQTEPLATVSKMDPLIVEFSVTEKEYAQRPQDDMRLEISSLCSSTPCTMGNITFLDNHFDPQTGMILIRGKVPNSELTMRPGQTVRIQVPLSVAPRTRLIPQKAIRYNQEGPYVFVIQEDSTVAARPLILGEERGEEQVVREGLDPEERIVVEGHLRLSPGTKVEVKS